MSDERKEWMRRKAGGGRRDGQEDHEIADEVAARPVDDLEEPREQRQPECGDDELPLEQVGEEEGEGSLVEAVALLDDKGRVEGGRESRKEGGQREERRVEERVRDLVQGGDKGQPRVSAPIFSALSRTVQRADSPIRCRMTRRASRSRSRDGRRCRPRPWRPRGPARSRGWRAKRGPCPGRRPAPLRACRTRCARCRQGEVGGRRAGVGAG